MCRDGSESVGMGVRVRITTEIGINLPLNQFTVDGPFTQGVLLPLGMLMPTFQTVGYFLPPG